VQPNGNNNCYRVTFVIKRNSKKSGYKTPHLAENMMKVIGW